MVGTGKSWRWVIKAAGLFWAHVIWKLSGTKSSGKRLIAALNSRNENLRTLAGIFLVRSGRRAIPLLEEELANRRNLPRILMLLGDMDEPESEEYLKKYLGDHDPKVADTAKQAMRNLLFKHGHC